MSNRKPYARPTAQLLGDLRTAILTDPKMRGLD